STLFPYTTLFRSPSRQQDREATPLALLRFHRDAAIVRLDDAADDGQPEAGPPALAVSLLVHVEDPWQGGRRDADAGVFDVQLHLRPGVDHTHRDASAGRRETDGIGDQVDHGLHQLILAHRRLEM